MKTLLALLALFTITSVQAQKGQVPPLTQPPPYGAYFFDIIKQSKEEQAAALDAMAKHYGYQSETEAYRACQRAKTEPNCSGDIVAHRRAESAEIAKYGFKTWKEAVYACAKNSKKEFGPYTYCSADPFLKLRSKK